MATTIDRIGELLKEAGIQFEINTERGWLETAFRVAGYTNRNGDPGVSIVVAPAEDGEFLRIVAPWCYRCTDPARQPVVLQACNQAMRAIKMVRLEFDPADGEVSVQVHLPLEDASPTRRQLLRALTVIPYLIELADPIMRAAIERGESIPLEDPEELRLAFDQFLRVRRARRETASRVALEE